MEKTETLFLPSDNLLEYCGSPLGREDSERIFSYASFAVNKMLQKSVKAYGKLKLSVFDGLFSGISSISELTEKRYPDCPRSRKKVLMSCVLLDEICNGKPVFLYPISEDNGKYRLLPVERLSVRLEDGYGGINGNEGLERAAAKMEKSAASKRSFPLLALYYAKKRKEILIKIGAAIMKNSVKELEFVTLFNEETFFKLAPAKSFGGGRVNAENKTLLTAFAALYAMTFYGLSFRDIYTVEEVFGFSEEGIRAKDTAKSEAAARLLTELQDEDGNKTAFMLIKMGETLTSLPLPEINTENFAVLAENYVFYSSVSCIGEAYIKAVEASEELPDFKRAMEKNGCVCERALKRADLLCDYRYAAQLCEEIFAMTEKGRTDILKARGRRKAEELRKRAEKENSDE